MRSLFIHHGSTASDVFQFQVPKGGLLRHITVGWWASATGGASLAMLRLGKRTHVNLDLSAEYGLRTGDILALAVGFNDHPGIFANYVDIPIGDYEWLTLDRMRPISWSGTLTVYAALNIE